MCQIVTKIWWVGGKKIIDGLSDFAHAKLAPALADPKKCELPTKISGQRRTVRGIDMPTAI